jgi:Na+/H+-dicarboxylate symporter
VSPRLSLSRQIVAGLVAGAVVGIVSKLAWTGPLNVALVSIEPIGTAFIRLATMTVVPLVIGSLFTGVASLGDIRRLGAIGGRTFAYFLVTTFLAAAIGLGVARMAPFHVAPRLAAAAAAVPVANTPTLSAQLLALIPQNPFAAAVQGDLLPLIVAVCLFAAAATTLPDDRRRQVVAAFERLNELSMVLIGWLMRLAPIAVFVLIAATVARFGAGFLTELLTFAATVLLALTLHICLVLLPALRVAAGYRVGQFLRDTSDALLLALATASSSATLPVSMAAAERIGVPAEVTGFVLPAGTTVNKNGAAAYKAVTAVFLATLYGLPLGPGRQLAIVLASTAAAFAGAGVPGSSLVTTLIVLNAIGLGSEAAAGIALIAAIDRPLDMCRTAVNTLGSLVGAGWVGSYQESAATRARVGAPRASVTPSAAP